MNSQEAETFFSVIPVNVPVAHENRDTVISRTSGCLGSQIAGAGG
jgi:hypothetical protein